MVMAKSLLCVEDSANRVEYSTQGYEGDKLPRGVTQKEWEEKDHSPTHHQVYRQAHRRYRATRKRFVENAENHHHPLQDENQPALPAPNYRERDGRVAACDGEIDEYVVENMKNLLVACVVKHRVVERRNQKHQKQANAEDAHAKCHQHIAAAIAIRPSCRKRNSQQH